jgi:integrase/recombinase XerD
MIEGRAKTLSHEEFTRLIRITGVERHALRNIAILYSSFALGLRVGEIASLCVGDVMNDDGTIKDQFQIMRVNSKNRRNREVFLTNTKVRKALKAYLDDRRQNCDIAMVSTSPLFRSQKGGAFTGHSLQMAMKTMFRKANLPETVSSHSGRRSFATNLLNQQHVNIRTVQQLLGHANISQTSVYCDADPMTMRNVVARVI